MLDAAAGDDPMLCPNNAANAAGLGASVAPGDPILPYDPPAPLIMFRNTSIGSIILLAGIDPGCSVVTVPLVGIVAVLLRGFAVISVLFIHY
jgi:hypothetical protein